MSTYVVGDIQGCYTELQQLLDVCHFDDSQDILWSTGDLVNRGPNSLEVLRFFKSLNERAVVVLGNHDLHLLAVNCNHEHLKLGDTLSPILNAPDVDELLTWLRYRPLLYYDEQLNTGLIHAGLPPQWTIKEASKYAQKVEAVLRSSKYEEYLTHYLYGNKPEKWSDALNEWDKLRFITNCLTRLRYCNAKGKLLLKKKTSPQTSQQNKEQPWFKWSHRASNNTQIIFGHWATLGYYEGHNVYGLDSGCVWGGALTALRLEDKQIFTVDCKGECVPTI
ncbi:MAG: symmetrical bis(5'-nucleosyl)-tetraphosphatase [Thiomargarita sp.]|nr:symmetrical bis(5'-nucleosyl)-tetraphosphatase [Thiomargarita sp.]